MNKDILPKIETILKLKSEDREAINEYKKIKDQLEQHIIPESYPELSSMALLIMGINYPEELNIDNLRRLGGYCNVSKNWIRELLPLLTGKRCLEIMSGAGMFAYALQQEGIEIIPTDSKEWYYENYWCDVATLDCVKAIEKYGTSVDFIICSWIPFGSDAGTKALLKMREINPEAHMLYIGEMGKACADESFVDTCEIIDNIIVRNANRVFKSWPLINDRIFLLK